MAVDVAILMRVVAAHVAFSRRGFSRLAEDELVLNVPFLRTEFLTLALQMVEVIEFLGDFSRRVPGDQLAGVFLHS